jgi:hypothetical protein
MRDPGRRLAQRARRALPSPGRGSSNGVACTAPARVPTSVADQFIPGLAVDASTSGGSADLALTYYVAQARSKAMYAPTSKLSIATPAEATRASSAAGASEVTGVAIGETHLALKRD